MNQQITREILWNVPVAFRIFLYAMLIPLTAAFVYEGMRWYRMVSLGQPIDRLDQPQRRLWLGLRPTARQGNQISGRLGLIHLPLSPALPGPSPPSHNHLFLHLVSPTC